jgi:hypothetical protein
LIIREDTIVIAGHKNSFQNSEIYLYKCSLDGDSISLHTYDLDNDIFTFVYGFEETESHYVLYGDMSLEENNDIIGYLAWIHKNGTFDTLITEPERYQIAHSGIDTQGLLTILYERRLGNVMYRGINKYNSDREIIWGWEHKFRSQDRSFYQNFEILEDNTIIDLDLPPDRSSLTAIYSISPSRSVNWFHFVDQPDVHNYYKIIQSNDDSIIIVGSYQTFVAGDLEYGGHISKFNKQGDLLWDRNYFLDSADGEKLAGSINAVQELEDGRLVLVGLVKTVFGRRDPWVLILDSEGCLEKDCGTQNFITAQQNRASKKHPCPITLLNNIGYHSLRTMINDPSILSENISYKIYSQHGLEVAHEKLSGNQIDVSNLLPGSYILLFLSREGRLVCNQKFVKQ